jgi:hypothetical protein
MRTEIITRHEDLLIRRLILGPGEATPWHVDVCRRFTVVVCGDQLSIEFRDGRPPLTVAVRAGMAEWDEPHTVVHRAVNTGATPYEEVVTFFLDAAGIDPQPERS